MSCFAVSAADFLKMVKKGAASLNESRKEINDLNVFPIPDGDTGDNMYMTIRSGCDAMSGESASSLGELASIVSKGMLFGARGNSGVILSRIFAGIAKGLEAADAADLELWKKAMSDGVSEAYKSVAVPVEGTMLTVVKDAVREANGSGVSCFEDYFDVLCREASASLERTPELLPVLKEAGVVDSGGAGLVYILEGMKAALEGDAADIVDGQEAGGAGKIDLDAFTEDSELKFGYCTEFLLRLQTAKVGDVSSFDEAVIRDYLSDAGASLVFIREGSIVKVHVHTRTPGDILSACQKWGEFLKIKVENMTLQHHENNMDRKVFKGPRKKSAVVTVASGEGLVNILKETGADFVIEGGQTMNPSAESFVEAFDRVNADVIYVLPNNSNIILTARQAAGLYRDSDVRVIATKSVGSGYAVLGSVDFSGNDFDAVVKEAEEIAAGVVTGMVSKAIRDTKDAVKGDYIGFSGGEILCDSSDRNDAVTGLCRKLNAGDSDVILLFKGADVPSEEADALNSALQAEFRRAEVIMCDGGQAVFDYILILE